MAVFGIVMLLKPVSPLGPLIVKDMLVVVWVDVIVALDMSELTMFPLIPSATVAPLSVVAGTVTPNDVLVDGEISAYMLTPRCELTKLFVQLKGKSSLKVCVEYTISPVLSKW